MHGREKERIDKEKGSTSLPKLADGRNRKRK
jgi:hypothetical protein